MTEPGGPAWRQTIFHPFSLTSRFGRGNVLRTHVRTDSYSTSAHPKVDSLLASVVHDSDSGRATVFALNRAAEPMELSVELQDLGGRKSPYARTLHHPDLKATNTRAAPDTIVPTEHRDAEMKGGQLRTTLPPLSWSVLVTERQ